VRQLELSTTEDDSNMNVLEIVSIIRITKNVCDSNEVSVVLQVVGREGFSKVLMVRVNVE